MAASCSARVTQAATPIASVNRIRSFPIVAPVVKYTSNRNCAVIAASIHHQWGCQQCSSSDAIVGGEGIGCWGTYACHSQTHRIFLRISRSYVDSEWLAYSPRRRQSDCNWTANAGDCGAHTANSTTLRDTATAGANQLPRPSVISRWPTTHKLRHQKRPHIQPPRCADEEISGRAAASTPAALYKAA